MPSERERSGPPVGPLGRTEQRILATAGFLIVLVVLIAAVAGTSDDAPDQPAAAATGSANGSTTSSPSTGTTDTHPATPPTGVVADPDDLTVLVDRERRLPQGWQPSDLVPAPVPFTFEGDDPRRLLRPEAAAALGELFGSAAGDGLPLRAVSGFRSEEAQQAIHDDYVAEDGVEAADSYSARPGHSEHQTGLAVDVTSFDGACPAEPCFADRPEADWLVDNAHRFGFVVRYPAGRESVTGYDHEPWHLRYVGRALATELHEQDLTLDEWYGTGG